MKHGSKKVGFRPFQMVVMIGELKALQSEPVIAIPLTAKKTKRLTNFIVRI